MQLRDSSLSLRKGRDSGIDSHTEVLLILCRAGYRVLWRSTTTRVFILVVPLFHHVTNCIIEDKILIDANLISQIMDRPKNVFDTSMVINWVKFELRVGKIKPDIRDLAKHPFVSDQL